MLEIYAASEDVFVWDPKIIISIISSTMLAISLDTFLCLLGDMKLILIPFNVSGSN